MRDLADRALDTAAQLGAGYADVRIVRRLEEDIAIKSGRVEGVASGESEGFGLRVLVDGAWGFASSSQLSGAEADRVAGEAVRIAARRRPRFAIVSGSTTGRRPEGPTRRRSRRTRSTVPLEEKIRTSSRPTRRRRGQGGDLHRDPLRRPPRVEDVRGDGRQLHGADADPRRRGRRGERDRRRRAPAPELPGWGRRAVQGRRLRVRPRASTSSHAEPLAAEAVELLSAPQCPPGRFTIVLDPSQLYMQVHESCGHPSELDRVFGTEASYAGTSFLTTDKLDDGFRYGSDLVDIVADATASGGLGTFGWDDEGVAAASVPIVREGIFVGYLTSRETAPRIGRQSGGAMRADGWNRIPLIRMTNLNLLPKPGMSLDDIVADTDDGFYLASNRSWSIDDRRLNFQFATEIAYEIKNGKKGRLFKNPTYTGITYEFWRSCDAVGDERSYVMLGTPNCGKGEPGQAASVGHGTSGARFRDVQMGVGKW